jgi:hypothetical protein
MDTCARCGEELTWAERNTVFWNMQLRKGYIKFMVMASPQFGQEKKLPEYEKKKLCLPCVFEIFEYGHICPKCGRRGTPHICRPERTLEAKAIEDFASLREWLTKKGIVMQACNCPKCNNMADIPETGKILICKSCGTPIKPVDVYLKTREIIER